MKRSARASTHPSRRYPGLATEEIVGGLHEAVRNHGRGVVVSLRTHARDERLHRAMDRYTCTHHAAELEQRRKTYVSRQPLCHWIAQSPSLTRLRDHLGSFALQTLNPLRIIKSSPQSSERAHRAFELTLSQIERQETEGHLLAVLDLLDQLSTAKARYHEARRLVRGILTALDETLLLQGLHQLLYVLARDRTLSSQTGDRARRPGDDVDEHAALTRAHLLVEALRDLLQLVEEAADMVDEEAKLGDVIGA